MLTIYGHPQSRTFRCLWLLKELGIEYEHVPTSYRDGGTRTPEFLAINPNGHVPALVDGDLRLFESMAINLYLARKYGKALWPATMEDQARAVQWSFWAMTETEASLLALLTHSVVLPEAQRDPAALNAAVAALAGPFAVLDGALANSAHLLGETFTVADLNVAAVLSWAKIARHDFSSLPRLQGWLDKCLERPAAVASRR